ncbi:unnamed protein product [Cyberlindnera jadinii]|uniref:DNA-directed RNA polymerase III subunit RPC4 n=1 Tax=Cyberlindnera jadinii (strain ATCC 18201 / CBS 1600 / BCRC 20928 / JCM 3617 / NBRC 0987 / NRRL Y-1542) TaxID=983966 RepID=A0A0H5CL15_CYBJN|nr:hypothetical protein CYBJADRAFT_172553 [Cyberlindnera jadinii NRRL Y-1542]ODV73778.1 hypothetical protein CYBJADRAFT_172553 [Cyberlindnera jadinii NRRL Y-1542]CEP25179.1 unnamed protein product [Cyberlindnera jadinii]
MSDKIPTSSRLDSLSRRAPAGPASSSGPKAGKFKPKNIARRTKEERDANAPATAAEPTDKPHQRSMRGGLRGGRGGRGGANRALQGTHLVQAGPLASGNVLSDTKQNFSRSTTRSPTPGFLSSLVKREEGSREGSVGPQDSDDEGDLSKINMNQEYRFSKEETELFPVRAPREHVTSEQDTLMNSSRSTTPEPDDGTLKNVLATKDHQLHINLDQLQVDEAAEDDARLAQDHKDIAEAITKLNNDPASYLMFQLPRVLPEFETTNEVKPEISEEDNVEPVKPQLEGQIATLRVHRSGKLSVKIGNVIMDVSKGSNTAFLQQLVCMKRGGDSQLGENEIDERGNYLLGHLQDKIVITPKLA